jgi:hypothetical protein
MPLVEEVKQSIKEYEKNISLKNNAQAAEMAVQIAELLFEQCEEIDSTLSEQARSRIEKDSLKKSLQYSEKALVELRASQNKEQQARSVFM